jgi:hypothetical protein
MPHWLCSEYPNASTLYGIFPALVLVELTVWRFHKLGRKITNRNNIDFHLTNSSTTNTPTLPNPPTIGAGARAAAAAHAVTRRCNFGAVSTVVVVSHGGLDSFALHHHHHPWPVLHSSSPAAVTHHGLHPVTVRSIYIRFIKALT